VSNVLFTYVFSFSTDGYDAMDTSSDANGVKNQTVGLLQAVSYLKGIFSIHLACGDVVNLRPPSVALMYYRLSA